ncbi:MAG: hypothetical protein QW039_01920 [Fervidicoccaceae archaeon]
MSTCDKLSRNSCIETGIPTIDQIIGCIPTGAIAEIYGEELDLVLRASYIATANFHCNGGAALGIVQERAMNYDIYMLRMMLRALGCSEDGLLISRAFRLEDAIGMIREAISLKLGTIVIIDPYVHSPKYPREYWKLTPLTASFREAIAKGKRIVLFNRITKFGRYLPEGGKMHHHSASILVKIERRGSRSYRAILIKHPSRPESSALGAIRELNEVRREWEGQYLLLEWL